MNKRQLKNLLAFMLATFSLSASAAEPLPPNEGVLSGTLDNGLTYYVRRNNYPQNRADFFIAQRVGSVQENDNQRGLAHFLEHMCFNGTKHFPGNSLISYLESIGVKFGANLNAYTSTDETVYNICNVPTSRKSALDSCFLILGDWANGLLLRGKDIDEERGVIEGERRTRSSAANRMLERALPQLYPGSVYGLRMPIGDSTIIRNFKHKELRDYYRKWYHPGNQCVVVVGDIDPAWAVEKIKETFGKIKQPKNATPVLPVAVPDNDSLIAVVESDKEQSQSMLRMLFKHNDLPQELAATTAYLETDYLRSVMGTMLSERLQDLALEANAPFTRAVAHDRNYMLSKTRKAFEVIAFAKPGSENDCAQELAREVQRARKWGFTEGEFNRARIKYESELESLYQNRDKYPNSRYARDFVRTFLDGEPNLSIEDFYRLSLKVIDSVNLNRVNQQFRSLFADGERNVVIAAFCSAGKQLPTRESLTQAYRSGMTATVEAYVDSVRSTQLLQQLPKAGKVVAEDSVPSLGAKVWTLSNGLKVFLKHTDIKADEIVVAAAAPGGLSLDYTAADAPSLKAINSVMGLSGYGQFTSSELKKVLAGKKASVRTFVSKTEIGLQGSTSPRDMETEFQLMYLKLTQPRKDQKAFDNFIEQNRVRLKNQNDPKFEFADSIFSNVFARHPMGAEKLTASDIDRVNYDKILEVYKRRFGNVAGMDFYIVGNFNEDSLRTIVERYVASLPASGAAQKPQDIGYRLFPASKQNFWQSRMETPQDKVYFFWTNGVDFNLRNRTLATVTGQVMSAIFLDEIREKRGWTYHVDSHCAISPNMNGSDAPVIFMPLNVTVTAGKGAETRQVVSQLMEKVAKDGPTLAQLNKVKQYLRKVQKEDLDDNTYWMVQLKDRDKYGIDFHSSYLQVLDSITQADVRDFLAHILQGRCLELTMTPAK